MTRIVGIDSWNPISSAMLKRATELMGQTPAFWGTYFHGPSNAAPEYNAVTCGSVLRGTGIRVLPVLRQTNRVGLGRDEGTRDGELNAKDILSAFGEDYLRRTCGHVRAFLDVEGDKVSRLSREYYLGLCDGLASVTDIIWPCVYGLPGDMSTWRALAEAMDQGAQCHGAWLAAPYVSNFVAAHEPIQWVGSMMKLYPLSSRVPVLLWQYGFPAQGAPANEQFDRNMINPEQADASSFLRTLPLVE